MGSGFKSRWLGSEPMPPAMVLVDGLQSTTTKAAADRTMEIPSLRKRKEKKTEEGKNRA